MKAIKYSQFRDRIDIDELEQKIGFETIRHQGGNDIGHCLFPENHAHGDTTGKFAIHRDKKVWNCWVCDGGDLVSLVMQLYDLDSDAAVEWLYQFAKAEDTRTDSEFTDAILAKVNVSRDRDDFHLPYFNMRVLDRFDGPLDYFYSRGISDPICRKYSLRTGEGTKLDYTGPAAIFPHFWEEKLVGWQYRWLDWDEKHTKVPVILPKWNSTSEFPKKETLFNYHNTLKDRSGLPVIVVESMVTTLFLESLGLPSVAHFGSSLTNPQLKLLRAFNQGIIFSPDNDVGEDAIRRAEILDEHAAYLERFIPVFLTAKVEGKKADLADYAQAEHPDRAVVNHLAERTEPYAKIRQQARLNRRSNGFRKTRRRTKGRR